MEEWDDYIWDEATKINDTQTRDTVVDGQQTKINGEYVSAIREHDYGK
jgi:hypothetical protein